MVAKKRKSPTEETPATAVTIAPPTEENFVRGGASALTPLEHKEISTQAANDLFKAKKDAPETGSAAEKKGPAKKKRKADNKTKATEKPTKKDSDKAYIDSLTFKKLNVGTVLLGCISQINEFDLLVSLPHELVGVVPMTEISDSFTTLVEKAAHEKDDDDEDENMEDSVDIDLNKRFHVGQWVRCRITSVTEEAKKKKVELSLKPNVVNEDILKADVTPGLTLGASVKSVEDHGYILDLGVKDLAGFLPMKESKSYIEKYNRDEELAVGQYVECAVEKADKRTANVTIDRKKVGSAVVSEPFSRVTSVLPGQLVSGVIESVQPNGISLKMMGLYATTIDRMHIPSSVNAEKKYKLGQNLTFRTLYTILNTDEKKITGSVLPHVLELDTPVMSDNKKSDKYVGDVFPVGSFLDNVKVAHISRSGVLVTLESLSGVSGFVHISRLSDDHVKSISATSGKYMVGSTHRARVLGYNPVDAVLIMTFQQSILDEQYLRISDIDAGSMVEGTVEKLVPAGIVVRLSKNITGLVPTVHMSDAKLTRPEFKFKVGKKIQCRVLRTNTEKHQVFFTLKKSLINSEFPIFTDINDINVDDISHGTIISIRKKGCIVGYYNDLTAFVPGSEMIETHIPNLGDAFQVGQTVKTHVLVVDKEQNKLVVSLINSKKKLEKKAASKAKLDAKHEAKEKVLAPGDVVTATIKQVKKEHLGIELPGDLEGRVHISEVYKSFDDITNKKRPLSQFKVNQEIEVKVLGIRNLKKHTYLPLSNANKVSKTVDCSLRLESDDDNAREAVNMKAGQEFLGFITAIHSNFLTVHISTHTYGTINKQFASSDPDVCNKLIQTFLKGEAIRVSVLSVGAKSGAHHFMHVDNSDIPIVTDFASVKNGLIVNGFVKKIDTVGGLLVQLSPNVAGKVYLTDISDTFTENPTEPFEENQVVRVSVINVNEKNKQIDLSLRESRLSPDVSSNEIKTFKDVKRGQVYEAYVNNIGPSGVFIKLNHALSARVKIANLTDEFVKEWKGVYKVGQLVKTKVIYIDYDAERLEATLKKSVIENTDTPKKSKTKVEEESDEDMAEVPDSDVEMEEAGDDSDDSEDEQEDDKEESDSDDDDESEKEDAPALKIDEFDWTGVNNRKDSSDEEESDEESDEEEGKSKNKKQKKEVEDLTAELNSNAPQTAADYERLLVGSPNSSYLWINYMAYQLQLSEIARAREIGERALKTINFREEQEKMNVWVALLNLENNFGTDETLQEVFKRALVYCEPLKIYLQLVNIYERSDKNDKAQALWEEMTKKFGQEPEVWTGFGLYYLEHDNADGARELLQQSLKVLPKHEHVQTIVKFAQLEFKHGEAERGRTILEGVMSNYPKRLDLWNVYLDMEIKADDIEMARRLFERVTSMKFSSKKMKFLFKKWLQFEKDNGNEDDIQRVKERTLAYVESMS